MKYLMLGAAALALAACSQETTSEAVDDAAPAANEAEATTDDMDAGDAMMSASEKLDAVLAAQSDDAKARYEYRHPKETLEFFGVEPGMTVVDTLAGQTWYAGILSDYLGPDGKVIAADYSIEMWPLFGGFATEEWIENRRGWAEKFVADAEANIDEDDAPVEAFIYGSLPAEMHGVADVVLMVRAAHHFNRFEDGKYFTEALADVNDVLKPGGVLGVVQHRAPEGNSDEWATGDNGYLKQSQVISVIENAGFEFVEASEINANPKDQPTEEDIVWRLPPTTTDNEETLAIGESDRMTLKFKKPE